MEARCIQVLEQNHFIVPVVYIIVYPKLVIHICHICRPGECVRTLGPHMFKWLRWNLTWIIIARQQALVKRYTIDSSFTAFK